MKLIKYIGTISLCATLFGCSDFLEEYSQDTYYVTSYEDLDELLIGDCYCPVHECNDYANSSNIGNFIHLLGDELQEQNGWYTVDYDSKQHTFGYFTWQERVGTKETYSGYYSESGTWTELYRLINVANNILASALDVPQETQTEIDGVKRVEGEAHFLRAAYYFFLVNLYGKPYTPSTASTDLGVPIKIEDKVNDIKYQRNTVQEVYDQILADLKEAEADLKDLPERSSIYRAGITAVNLLSSRVYLYMQNWEAAATYADKVIAGHGKLCNLSTNSDPFLSKSQVENIFSMGGNDVPCIMCNNYQSLSVSQDLYTLYDENDLRRTQWWWSYEDFVGYTKVKPVKSNWGGDDIEDADYYFYNYEWTYSGRKVEISDKFLYRSAEAYLNKAEAEAYLSKESEARAAVNTLRQNRYAEDADYEIKSSGDELIREIRNERFRELALEGHRWFDLRRYGVCSVCPESKRITHRYTYYKERGSEEMTECHIFVLEPNDPGYTLPIPYSVLEFNTGMENNERVERQYTVEPVNNYIY